MDRPINAKQLRAMLPTIVGRVRRGERFTVLYRSRPAFRIVPIDRGDLDLGPLEDDPLYRAPALYRSGGSVPNEEIDEILYPKK